MSRTNRKTSILALSLLATFAFIGTAALATPVYACVCNTITFDGSSTSGSPTVTVSSQPQVFTSGNTVSYSDFGKSTAEYMLITVSSVTAGWTVSITSADTVTTVSSTQIIVGLACAATNTCASSGISGTFPFTITVTAPSSPGAMGSFKISAEPWSQSTYSGGSNPGVSCSPLTVDLETSTPFPPPTTGVPEFPVGMVALLGLAIPVLVLMKGKLSKIPSA